MKPRRLYVTCPWDAAGDTPNDPRTLYLSVYDITVSPRPSDWPLRLSRAIAPETLDAFLREDAALGYEIQQIHYEA